MRVLIGAACVAIVAFVGYFFLIEYRVATALNTMRRASPPAVSQARQEELPEDDILDKLAGVDFNQYDRKSNPELFEHLHPQTISGELQRLRIFAAKDAAKFTACKKVTSSTYSAKSTKTELAVDVTCAGGIAVSYDRRGPISPIGYSL